MPASVETAVQTDLQTIMKAIGLAAPMLSANVGLIREQPKADEIIDTLPCVLICQRAAPAPVGLGFEGASGRSYVEEVIVIDAREGDATTDQARTQLWYEQCYNAAEKNTDGSWRVKLTTATSVYDVRISAELKGFDPAKLSSNYAYLSFFVTVRSSE